MTVTNTVPPAISGTARQGQTLVSTNGTWTFDLDYLTYAYQWLRCDANGANCVSIPGATLASYVLVLADVGKRLRSQVTATEVAYPSGGLGELTWSPPATSSPVNFTLTNATRSSSLLGAGAGRDLVIDQTEVLTGPVTQIAGWRNVVWIGGEINIGGTTDTTVIAIRNITGTFHIEGVYIHGTGVSDAFVIRSPETSEGCIVQVEYCRFEVNDKGGEHADCVQLQNAKVDAYRIDLCTFVTDLQGTFMRVGVGPADFCKNVDFKRLNYKGGGDNMFWQNWETGDSTVALKQIVPVTLDDVWIDPAGSARPNVARRVVPDSTGYSGGQSNSRRAAYLDSDGIGEFCYFSDGTQLAPNGQQSLDCQIDGIIRSGIPPGGDFAPADVVGMGYVSPGYL